MLKKKGREAHLGRSPLRPLCYPPHAKEVTAQQTQPIFSLSSHADNRTPPVITSPKSSHKRTLTELKNPDQYDPFLAGYDLSAPPIYTPSPPPLFPSHTLNKFAPRLLQFEAAPPPLPSATSPILVSMDPIRSFRTSHSILLVLKHLLMFLSFVIRSWTLKSVLDRSFRRRPASGTRRRTPVTP